mmetsp:Transcript_46989/g.102062  ORF Transcript_46989/g.102062 Transcript_46989/m.102062 type:complete len:304 (-) Transcript_46989:873-1784(-)
MARRASLRQKMTRSLSGAILSARPSLQLTTAACASARAATSAQRRWRRRAPRRLRLQRASRMRPLACGTLIMSNARTFATRSRPKITASCASARRATCASANPSCREIATKPSARTGASSRCGRAIASFANAKTVNSARRACPATLRTTRTRATSGVRSFATRPSRRSTASSASARGATSAETTSPTRLTLRRRRYVRHRRRRQHPVPCVRLSRHARLRSLPPAAPPSLCHGTHPLTKAPRSTPTRSSTSRQRTPAHHFARTFQVVVKPRPSSQVSSRRPSIRSEFARIQKVAGDSIRLLCRL